jgi:hypothetical protein
VSDCLIFPLQGYFVAAVAYSTVLSIRAGCHF